MNAAGILDLVPHSLRDQWKREGAYPNISVFDAFKEKTNRFPNKVAIHTFEREVTYAELLDSALRIARGLKQCGIVAGDVVAYQLNNSWRCCAIDLAAAALGAIAAPFPPGRGRLDIQSMLRRSCARALIIEGMVKEIDFCDIVESIRPQALSLRFLVTRDKARPGWQLLDDILALPPLVLSELPKVDPDSPCRMLVSSGTESEPKLVAYSHNALLGGRGRFLQHIHPEKGSFRGMYLVPLGSSFGSTATIGALCWLGGSIVLLPKFDPELAVQAIERFKPSYILGVPTMLQRMLSVDALKQSDRSSLIALISGGANIDRATIERCQQNFACGFINLYGSADGVNCPNERGAHLDLLSHSVGKPNNSVCEINIVDDLHKPLPDGLIGEIRARGPLSPMQYVNDPKLNQTYRDKDGWVYTGDLGYIDQQGYLVLAGRKKDVIIRGGANISPAQIENQATSHPDIISAACVPVPDEDLGNRVCICVTLRERAKRLSLQDLTDFLRGKGLEVNKLPEFITYYRQMPLNPAGKLDKKRLRKDVHWLANELPLPPEELYPAAIEAAQ